MLFSKKYLFLFLLLIGAVFQSCDEEPANPFDSEELENEEIKIGEPLDPNTIQGIHHNVFKPTCANSGCHDGTFEPNFQTIESSYNTLVNHPVISNTANQEFEARVQPNDVEGSMLIYRMTQFLPESSGIMPLSLEPDSDWEIKKEEYLDNIRNWINAGAPDMFSN